jgi:hypothetical protein
LGLKQGFTDDVTTDEKSIRSATVSVKKHAFMELDAPSTDGY